jgi:hypothetical protein
LKSSLFGLIPGHEDDVGALFGKGRGQGAPNAAGSAGDQNDIVMESGVSHGRAGPNKAHFQL